MDDFIWPPIKRSKTHKMPEFEVPDGFEVEIVGGNIVVFYSSHEFNGWINVDFGKRVFWVGFGAGYGRSKALEPDNPKQYDGSGWEQAIVEDAITWAAAGKMS